jgi:hypothetical protein
MWIEHVHEKAGAGGLVHNATFASSFFSPFDFVLYGNVRMEILLLLIYDSIKRCFFSQTCINTPVSTYSHVFWRVGALVFKVRRIELMLPIPANKPKLK